MKWQNRIAQGRKLWPWVRGLMNSPCLSAVVPGTWDEGGKGRPNPRSRGQFGEGAIIRYSNCWRRKYRLPGSFCVPFCCHLFFVRSKGDKQVSGKMFAVVRITLAVFDVVDTIFALR